MSALRPGLVSVSFRKLTAAQVATSAASAGLSCIEWGGDVHVPHGDLSVASEVRKLTADHGMSVSAYGSYLRLGAPDGPDPLAVVETASELGAPVIRVWAGTKGSAETSPEERRQVEAAAIRTADLAAAAGLRVAYEYHGNTLTDTPDSAACLLDATMHPAIQTFWQPPNEVEYSVALASIERVLPRLGNIHAFHWKPTPRDRRPLADGGSEWLGYLGLALTAGGQRDVLLEFLPQDDPELLPREADTLKGLIARAENDFKVSGGDAFS
ncbi:MAG: sugar phosphate isomerase/epimerase [Terrimicrobiaceae bacterium]